MTDSVVWNSVVAPTFTVDEISHLQRVLDAAMTEATAKGFDFPVDLMLRRLFEAAGAAAIAPWSMLCQQQRPSKIAARGWKCP